MFEILLKWEEINLLWRLEKQGWMKHYIAVRNGFVLKKTSTWIFKLKKQWTNIVRETDYFVADDENETVKNEY